MGQIAKTIDSAPELPVGSRPQAYLVDATDTDNRYYWNQVDAVWEVPSLSSGQVIWDASDYIVEGVEIEIALGSYVVKFTNVVGDTDYAEIHFKTQFGYTSIGLRIKDGIETLGPTAQEVTAGESDNPYADDPSGINFWIWERDQTALAIRSAMLSNTYSIDGQSVSSTAGQLMDYLKYTEQMINALAGSNTVYRVGVRVDSQPRY